MKTLLFLPLAMTAGLPLIGSSAGDNCSAATAHRAGKDIVETAVAAGQFNTLAKALTEADLVGALQGKGPFTVFAPTDDAFAALPEGTLADLLKPENKGVLTSILTYHVVPGTIRAGEVIQSDVLASLNGQRIPVHVDEAGVRVGDATIVLTDIECSNGVIHVIDRVIVPSTKDIVQTAVAAKKFGTLAAALKAAHLVETLQGEGPFTVFAPTDEAFAKLPKGTVESLLQKENSDKLTAILKYHVVPGRIFADQAVTAGRAGTAQGSSVRVRIVEGRLTVNDARVIMSDVQAANGVIHVIDSVLIPE